MSLVLKIKKLHPEAIVPEFAHADDAGMDFYAIEAITLKPGERRGVPTGIAMEIPEGYAGLFWDKSGMSIHKGIKTLGGVIDAGYRGEIKIGIINLSDAEYVIEKGHKVAQMLIQKIEHPGIIEVEELNDTMRGEGGFGSTGK